MAIQIGQVELQLMCTLTDQEVQSRGSMLGETIWAIDSAERERTSAMKTFKERLVGLNEQQRKLARIIRERAEERMVHCVVQFHTPCEGIKRVVRMDTGEVVREEGMTNAEKQLNLWDSQLEFRRFMDTNGVCDAPEEPAPDVPTVHPPLVEGEPDPPPQD